MTQTISEFLAARLDEDYETAFGGAPSPWREGAWDGEHSGAREVLDRSGSVTAHAYYGGTYGHVMRFDPTRMLAEIDAKRQVVQAHASYLEVHDKVAREAGLLRPSPARAGANAEVAVLAGAIKGLEVAMMLLALPYASHDDYREEWKP